MNARLTETKRHLDELDLSAIKTRLGPLWKGPTPYGDDSVIYEGSHRRIIVSIDLESEPGVPWIHASISYHQEEWRPAYIDLKQLHEAVFIDRRAYQCFVPADEHINIRANVLHLWGRLDGQAVLPDFGRKGTI